MAVYDHLFLVIGGGFSWHKGELVGDGLDSLPDMSVSEIQEAGLAKIRNEFETTGRPYSNYTLGLWKYRIENVLELLKENYYLDYAGFYRIHPNYSNITTLPDDITADWFGAAKEFVNGYYQFLNSRDSNPRYYLADLVEIQGEFELLKPIKSRIQELEARFIGVSDEEYLKIKKKQEEHVKKIIADLRAC